MYFVYRLQSIEHPEEKYTGLTKDISQRIVSHNNGQVPAHFKIQTLEITKLFYFQRWEHPCPIALQ